MTKKWKGLVVLISLSTFVGCATYQSTVSPSRQKLQNGQTEEALEDFRKLAEKEDGDQLVHLLDYGTALQYAGKFQESSKIFLKADKLADAVDYHSVSRVTGSLLFAEELVQYKGDTFEQIFINAFLALNYLEQGNLDDALVEARRINEKYLRLRQDEKKKFELNPFSKYLSALLWEANQNYDDAYIAYKEAYDLDLGSPMLERDLLRSAQLARRDQEYQDWKQKFPEVAKEVKKPNRSEGELVVLFLQGWGPRKVPDPIEPRFPILQHVGSDANHLEVSISGEPNVPPIKTDSKELYNVEKAAVETLREDRGLLVAKRLAGIAAKEIAADQIRQKNEALGFVAWIAMHASDRADLRQWSTLPESIQVIRVPLSSGKYRVSANTIANSGGVIDSPLQGKEITVKSGRKVFLVVRSLK